MRAAAVCFARRTLFDTHHMLNAKRARNNISNVVPAKPMHGLFVQIRTKSEFPFGVWDACFCLEKESVPELLKNFNNINIYRAARTFSVRAAFLAQRPYLAPATEAIMPGTANTAIYAMSQLTVRPPPKA